VKINGETHYMWRAVDHEGEVLDAFVTKRRDRKAALKFLRKLMKRYGQPDRIVTDKLRSYGAAMKEIGNADRCQRRSKIRPLGRSKSRPVWRERLGACGPHIASPVQGALAVRPILWGSFVGGGEAGAALIEAVAFAVHLEDVDVVCQPVQQRAGQALGAEGFGPLLEGQVRRDQGRSSLVAL